MRIWHMIGSSECLLSPAWQKRQASGTGLDTRTWIRSMNSLSRPERGGESRARIAQLQRIMLKTKALNSRLSVRRTRNSRTIEDLGKPNEFASYCSIRHVETRVSCLLSSSSISDVW